MSTIRRKLVVTGATGKQGGALIAALLATPDQPFDIYAVTRNAESKSAQALASKPHVHIIQGDFKDPKAIMSQVKEPWGLFSVTMPMNAAQEEREGKAMTAAAINAGVKHIVFTATDRGVNGDTDPTTVPHFASKFNIERDIISQTEIAEGKGKAVTYTFLRPVAFFENMSNDFVGRVFVAMWRANEPNDKLKMISTKDIGTVAAQAFLNSDSEQYKNRAIDLAGDELTVAEAAQIFEQVTGGQKMPETYTIVGKVLRRMLHEMLGIMFTWFRTDGFGSDVAKIRKEYPFLKDFRAWLETESDWRKM